MLFRSVDDGRDPRQVCLGDLEVQVPAPTADQPGEPVGECLPRRAPQHLVEQVTIGQRVLSDRAAALMDELGATSYAVVGRSMGGAVALALAAARPEQVTRVVAVSTMGAPGAGLSPDLDALLPLAPKAPGTCSAGWSSTPASSPMPLWPLGLLPCRQAPRPLRHSSRRRESAGWRT